MAATVGGLTKSMQGLREAVKRQENQLKLCEKKVDVEEIALFPEKEFIGEPNIISHLPDEKFDKMLERTFHSPGM